ncbi:MAG: phosphatidylglycerophosphatase A [Myxococcota bacterium]
MRRTLILGAASWFGTGYLPRMPGTWGTVGAIPLWWAMSTFELHWFVVATVVAIVISIWVSELAERIYGSHDVQHIVIDEVVGLLVAAIGVPFRWPEVLAAFILFRIFDMWKPPPIGWVDRQVGGGFGVVIDDVIAGLFALGLLHGARWALGGWW